MITNTNAAQVANNLIAVAEDQAFEAWYKQDCLVGGVNARIAARAAWNARAALTTAEAVPLEGWVMVPVELAERVQESLGEFLMDHGWSQRDMDTSDEFGAVLLAADPKAEPVPAGEYPPLPTGSAWCGDDDVRDFGAGPGESALMFEPTQTQHVPLFTAGQMRAYVDADRAMRAQAAPAVGGYPVSIVNLFSKMPKMVIFPDGTFPEGCPPPPMTPENLWKVLHAASEFGGTVVWGDAHLAAPAAVAGPGTYVQLVPDHCDRIVWRNHYHRLPLESAVPTTQAAPQPAVQQGDELPREDFAWLVVQEACETEPADEDDPECIRILRRDLKSAVLSAFLRHDAAHPAAPVAQGDALIDFIESAGSVHIHRVRAGFNGPIRWDVEYGYEDAKVSGRTLRDALSGVLKAGAASAAKELGA